MTTTTHDIATIGWTLATIAAHLKVPVNTVKGWKHRDAWPEPVRQWRGVERVTDEMRRWFEVKPKGDEMCKCTPEMRTPFCGRPGCEWPGREKLKPAEQPQFDVLPPPPYHWLGADAENAA